MKIFKKEKEVTELALKYLRAAERCVETCGKTIDAYLDGRTDEAATLREEASNQETQADRLRRKIGDKLFSGAYLPLLRGDIYSLIDSLDHVPNAAEASASLFVGEGPSVPDEFKERIRELTHASFGIIHPLHHLMKTFFNPKGHMDEIREDHKKIGIQESAVDQLEWNLTTDLYRSTLDLAHKHHLKKALDFVARVSDRAEDTADQLELVALKSKI